MATLSIATVRPAAGSGWLAAFASVSGGATIGDILNGSAGGSAFVQLSKTSNQTSRVGWTWQQPAIPIGSLIYSITIRLRYAFQGTGMSAANTLSILTDEISGFIPGVSPNSGYPAYRPNAGSVTLPVSPNAFTVGAHNVIYTAVNQLTNGKITYYLSDPKSIFGPSPSTANPVTLNLVTMMESVVRPPATCTNNEIYEAWLDIAYSAPPITVVNTPTGVQSTANPVVSWSMSDQENDPPERYQIKIFNSATYTQALFNPSVTTAQYDSGTVFYNLSTGSVIVPSSSIVNNTTYRVYVRTAAVGQPAGFWGPWATADFNTSYPVPGNPTGLALADPVNAKYSVGISVVAGTASTDFFELQRSDDGGATWNYVRNGSNMVVNPPPLPQPVTISAGTTVYGSRITAGPAVIAGPASIRCAATLPTPGFSAIPILYYDYETLPLVPVLYRARANHLVVPGQNSSSDWVIITPSSQLASPVWRLKDPLNPANNIGIEVVPPFTFSRREPEAFFDALGRVTSIYTTDGPKGIEGSIKIRLRTATDYNNLWNLVGLSKTLILEDWSLGRRWYVKFGDSGQYTTIMSAPDLGSTTLTRHLHEVTYTIREVAAP